GLSELRWIEWRAAPTRSGSWPSASNRAATPSCPAPKHHASAAATTPAPTVPSPDSSPVTFLVAPIGGRIGVAGLSGPAWYLSRGVSADVRGALGAQGRAGLGARLPYPTRRQVVPASSCGPATGGTMVQPHLLTTRRLQ